MVRLLDLFARAPFDVWAGIHTALAKLTRRESASPEWVETAREIKDSLQRINDLLSVGPQIPLLADPVRVNIWNPT